MNQLGNYSSQQMQQMLNQQQYTTTCGAMYTSPLALSDMHNQALNAAYLRAQQQATKPPGKKSMFKEIATDIRGFILEHRGVIYFIAFALLVDYFFFKGAFKTRLQGMADKVVTKVEEKIK